jgi:hypothetical protein
MNSSRSGSLRQFICQRLFGVKLAAAAVKEGGLQGLKALGDQRSELSELKL